MCVYAQLLSCVWLFATLWTVAHQAPLSMGFSRQEYCRVAISSYRVSSPPRDWTHDSGNSCVDRQVLYHCTTWETLDKVKSKVKKKKRSFWHQLYCWDVILPSLQNSLQHLVGGHFFPFYLLVEQPKSPLFLILPLLELCISHFSPHHFPSHPGTPWTQEPSLWKESINFQFLCN